MLKLNKTALRKSLRAIEYRLGDGYINVYARFALAARHLGEFAEEARQDLDLEKKVKPLIMRTLDALSEHDQEEALAGVALLRLLLPPFTYGEVTAGTRFKLPQTGDVIYVKRKLYLEWENPVCCRLIEHCRHIPCDTMVTLIK